jgi:steroid delta-isomerase
LLILLPLAAEAASGKSAPDQIRGALEKWTRAFNSADTRHVCDLFSRDLVANYQGQPERNYQSICEVLSKSLKDPERSYRYSSEVKEILVSGGLAVVRLVWTLEVNFKDGRQKQVSEEPGIDVLRRQADGSWKISRYLAYPASP